MVKNKKDFKLCLISVVDRNYVDEAPLNLLYLVDHLIKNKILDKKQVRIIDLDFEDPVKIVEKFKPDMIGMSVITPFYSIAEDIAEKIKEITKAPIVIGGYHISSLPDTIGHPFDIGVLGEGEVTLGELVTAFKGKKYVTDKKLSQISGLVFKNKKGKVVKTPMRPTIDLRKSEPVDWTIIPSEKLYQHQVFLVDGKPQIFKTVRVFSARGCPYNCSFCAHRVVWAGMRFYKVEKFADEIEFLYKEYGIKSFQIMDDTFAISKTRVRALTEELRNRDLLGKVFFSHLFIRANLIDDEFVQILKEFGAISVFIGIEFGSPRILKKFKDGQLTNEQVMKSTKLFKKYGIFVFGSFMLFAPTEEKEDLDQTFKLAKWFSNQKNALSLGYSVTTPYPGTKMWDEAIKMNVVDEDNIDWDDFLMFDLTSGDRDMTKIFFYNNLSDQDCEKYWNKFGKISNNVQDRWESIDGWIDSLKLADEKNQRLRAKIALKQRLSDFVRSPDSYVFDFFKNPFKIFKYAFFAAKDANRFLKRH